MLRVWLHPELIPQLAPSKPRRFVEIYGGMFCTPKEHHRIPTVIDEGGCQGTVSWHRRAGSIQELHDQFNLPMIPRSGFGKVRQRLAAAITLGGRGNENAIHEKQLRA